MAYNKLNEYKSIVIQSIIQNSDNYHDSVQPISTSILGLNYHLSRIVTLCRATPHRVDCPPKHFIILYYIL